METVEKIEVKKEEVKEKKVKAYDVLMEITATFLTKEDTMRTYKAMKLIKNITSHADSVRACVAHAEEQRKE